MFDTITVNQLSVLILLWVMGVLEDIWFDSLLKYQLLGQAARMSISPTKAVSFFDDNRNRYLWPLLSTGLCISILSFSSSVQDGFDIAMFVIGVMLCVLYIFKKLKPYNLASSLLQSK